MVDLDELRERGYVLLRGAVPPDVAARVHDRASALVADDGSPWALGLATVYDVPDLVAALSTAVREALDAILGVGEWLPDAVWGFPTRFPGAMPMLWHIDGDWFEHHVDSNEQVLTPIFLWHDVTDDDGPTLLVPGSHRRVARLLHEHEPHGIQGTDIAAAVDAVIDGRGAVPASGDAGDVYLCHPFLAHSVHPVGPSTGRRVVSNTAIHGWRRRPLDVLP